MDIIFLALVSLFIFYMLSKQFGKISEDEKNEIYRKIEDRKKLLEKIIEQNNQAVDKRNQINSSQNSNQKIVGESSTEEENPGFKNLNSSTKENLSKIFSACNLNFENFANGAKGAFEMTIKAFSDEDLETLRHLLSDNIYRNFESAITQRKQDNKKLITNLIAIDKFEITSAMLIDKQASITAKFISRQINYFTDNNGNLLDGRKDEISEISDIWTFKKEVSSPDPNWLIISTAS